MLFKRGNPLLRIPALGAGRRECPASRVTRGEALATKLGTDTALVSAEPGGGLDAVPGPDVRTLVSLLGGDDLKLRQDKFNCALSHGFSP